MLRRSKSGLTIKIICVSNHRIMARITNILTVGLLQSTKSIYNPINFSPRVRLSAIWMSIAPQSTNQRQTAKFSSLRIKKLAHKNGKNRTLVPVLLRNKLANLNSHHFRPWVCIPVTLRSQSISTRIRFTRKIICQKIL